MKKKVFLFILFLIIPICTAQVVDVDILGDFKYKITTFSYNEKISGVFNIGSELFNSGSIGYKAVARLDILNNADVIYTGWSPEKEINPGQRHKFSIYWYPEENKGNFSANVRFYLADEIEDLGQKSISVASLPEPKKTIDISKVMVYGEKIILSLESNETIGEVVIIPDDFPKGWFIEQKLVKNIQADKKYKVGLNHRPSVWKNSKVKVKAVSLDGKFYGEKEFILEQEKGILRFLYLLRDFIGKLS